MSDLMTIDERFEKGAETRNQALKMLNKYHNCFMVRVTGFGKTYNLIQIAKEFDKTYYILPRRVIETDIKDKYDLSSLNIEFITYQKLTSIAKRNAFGSYFNHESRARVLFILDEVHCAGADKTSNAIRELKDIFPKAYWIGATATPDRSDSFNISAEFFEGHQLDRYDIRDAIEEGFYAKPKYIYTIYELKDEIESIRKEAMELEESEIKDNVLEEIDKFTVQHNMILGIPDILKNNIDARKKYHKFFIFLPTRDALFAKHDTVVEWFQEAFPNFDIDPTIIISENKYRNNVDKLTRMKKTAYKIDLIFCIDMLNMGYHVDDVSGIIMLRGTSSDIINTQQIGRALSASSNTVPIIFDLVGNYNKETLVSGYKSIFAPGKAVIGEFDSDCIEATDYVTDIENIMRIWKNIIKDNPKMYADAYDHKNAPIKFAMHGMNCTTINQFVSILHIYGYELKDKDRHLLNA